MPLATWPGPPRNGRGEARDVIYNTQENARGGSIVYKRMMLDTPVMRIPLWSFPLDGERREKLRELSEVTGLSMAELARKGLDLLFEANPIDPEMQVILAKRRELNEALAKKRSGSAGKVGAMVALMTVLTGASVEAAGRNTAERTGFEPVSWPPGQVQSGQEGQRTKP